jgi:hypothetical protein
VRFFVRRSSVLGIDTFHGGKVEMYAMKCKTVAEIGGAVGAVWRCSSRCCLRP